MVKYNTVNNSSSGGVTFQKCLNSGITLFSSKNSNKSQTFATGAYQRLHHSDLKRERGWSERHLCVENDRSGAADTPQAVIFQQPDKNNISCHIGPPMARGDSNNKPVEEFGKQKTFVNQNHIFRLFLFVVMVINTNAWYNMQKPLFRTHNIELTYARIQT